MTDAVALYDEACRALAEARSTLDLLSVMNKAEALRICAHIAKDKTLESDAARIHVRAKRRLGEVISEGREAGLIRTGADNGSCDEPMYGLTRIKLSEIGVDKKTSASAQKLAALAPAEFERILNDASLGLAQHLLQDR